MKTDKKRYKEGFLYRKSHLFHVVFPSIWPFLTSVAVSFLLFSFLCIFARLDNAFNFAFISLIILLFVIKGWVDAIIDEATYKGHHTVVVQNGLVLGFYLFIISELMLFGGLFWAFFHFSLSPSIEVGLIIPAAGITNIPALGVPFVNTCLLLCSSVAATWAHKGVIAGSFRVALDGSLIAIILGFIFLVLQISEYKTCMFNISDGAYPSIFYMLTGLHGMHVFIGLVLLCLSVYRLLRRHFTTASHFGFLFASLYWHFVDVVWIFVYTFIYLWLTYGLVILKSVLWSFVILGFIWILVTNR